MTTFAATPVVLIEVCGDWAPLVAWCDDNGIEALRESEGWNWYEGAYLVDDAERVIAWLREHGAEERR